MDVVAESGVVVVAAMEEVVVVVCVFEVTVIVEVVVRMIGVSTINLQEQNQFRMGLEHTSVKSRHMNCMHALMQHKVAHTRHEKAADIAEQEEEQPLLAP